MSVTNTNIKKIDLHINGESVSSYDSKYFESINPSNGEVLYEIADGTVTDMHKAIDAARKAYDSEVWSELSLKDRGQYLNKIADLIRENAKDLADIETFDIGKTIKQSTFIDVPSTADTFEYFSNTSAHLQGNVNPVSSPVRSLTEREPVGVVGCIIPWNYPLIISAWKIAPALIAGNTVIVKPSPIASASVLKLAEIINKSGLPKGVFNVVSTTDNNVASELVKSSEVDMISFTGSTETGQIVMKQSSDSIKKLVMELGGKSSSIVFSDCDLDAALGGTMSSIFMNQGQMCTACSKLLLQDEIYDQFLEKLISKTKELKIGPAMDYQTDFGPLVSEEHRDRIIKFIAQGVESGARLVCGGKVPDVSETYNKGFYLEPTIFSDVDNSMVIAQQESFGPVLSVIKFSSLEEALKIANDTEYGLAASVWTKNLDKANVVSKKLKCGTVWVNTYGAFLNEAPFGGYKRSGFGRELGIEGLLEYTQSKHICFDMTPGGKSLVASWF